MFLQSSFFLFSLKAIVEKTTFTYVMDRMTVQTSNFGWMLVPQITCSYCDISMHFVTVHMHTIQSNMKKYIPYLSVPGVQRVYAQVGYH
jgi:hypothetical protein